MTKHYLPLTRILRNSKKAKLMIFDKVNNCMLKHLLRVRRSIYQPGNTQFKTCCAFWVGGIGCRIRGRSDLDKNRSKRILGPIFVKGRYKDYLENRKLIHPHTRLRNLRFWNCAYPKVEVCINEC